MAHPRCLARQCLAARPAPWSLTTASPWTSSLHKTGHSRLRSRCEQVRRAHIKGSSPRAGSIAKHKQPRHASQPSEQQKVLEKPDRYRRPSHPARLPRKSSSHGPALTQSEIEQQRTKQYPNMMPPEGTKLHWFLTSRRIHLVITFSILGSLGAFMMIENMRRSMAPEHKQLLPSWSLLPFHPLQFSGRLVEVYKLHVSRVSQETEIKRQQNVADAQKRAEFRKAHGIEAGGIPGMLGLKANKIGEGASDRHQSGALIEHQDPLQHGSIPREQSVEQPGAYQDVEGKKQKSRKWAPFGISLW